MARRAKSIQTLLSQVNARFPLRDTGSDGWIGDSAHASRPSDHNPDEHGVVQAQDFDEHASDGSDSVGRFLWDALRTGRDARISYLIYEGQMCSSYPARGYPAWAVRPYTGSNKHLQHLHLSVVDDPDLYDDDHPWALPGDEEDDMRLTDDDKNWLRKLVQETVNKGFEARDPLLREAAAHARADTSADSDLVAATAMEIANELAERLAE